LNDSSRSQCPKGDHTFPLDLNNFEGPSDLSRVEDILVDIPLKKPMICARLQADRMERFESARFPSLSVVDRRNRSEPPQIKGQQLH
jgi:hypothetical protein